MPFLGMPRQIAWIALRRHRLLVMVIQNSDLGNKIDFLMASGQPAGRLTHLRWESTFRGLNLDITQSTSHYYTTDATPNYIRYSSCGRTFANSDPAKSDMKNKGSSPRLNLTTAKHNILGVLVTVACSS